MSLPMEPGENDASDLYTDDRRNQSSMLTTNEQRK